MHACLLPAFRNGSIAFLSSYGNLDRQRQLPAAPRLSSPLLYFISLSLVDEIWRYCGSRNFRCPPPSSPLPQTHIRLFSLHAGVPRAAQRAFCVALVASRLAIAQLLWTLPYTRAPVGRGRAYVRFSRIRPPPPPEVNRRSVFAEEQDVVVVFCWQFTRLYGRGHVSRDSTRLTGERQTGSMVPLWGRGGGGRLQ